MNVLFLTPSVSRAAGGIFEIERSLAQVLLEQPGVNISVIGLEDRYSREDFSSWHPLKPQIFPIRGPAAFGFSHQLRQAIYRNEADLLHLHALWMYTSVVAYRWARRMERP